MSLTRTGAVSIATVAVVVPSDVVSVSVVSSFFLHAARAASMNRALAIVATRGFVPIMGRISSLCVGDGELQSGMDQVWIWNLVGVGGVNLLPLAGIAVELLGDLAQVVAALYGVGRSPCRGGRATR